MTRISNKILYIDDYFESWDMVIDLSVLVRDVGRIEKYRDLYGTYKQTVMKKTEAKRLLRFILPYLSGEDLIAMAELFADNSVLQEIFILEVKRGRRFYELDSTGTRN